MANTKIFSSPDIDYSSKHRPDEPKPVLPSLQATPGTPSVNPRIFELENKPKTVLAHDRGAGAPCLSCKNCHSGLDLHFWRKICRNCKCRKEDHDVHDFSEDPGKILIGRLFDVSDEDSSVSRDNAAYTVSRSLEQRSCSSEEARKSLSSKKTWVERNGTVINGTESLHKASAERDAKGRTLKPTELTFGQNKNCGRLPDQKYEWIPPGSTPQLVQKYMEMLPKENRPIEGTEGALKRRKALEYQFPLHDCDPTHMHRKLTEEEGIIRNTNTLFRTVITWNKKERVS